jgi:hypothetical protein
MDPQIDQPVACSVPWLATRAPAAHSAQIAAAAIADGYGMRWLRSVRICVGTSLC